MTTEPSPSLGAFVTELGGMIGGVLGLVVRWGGRIIQEKERFDSEVALRIDRERKLHMAAGAAAHEASRFAGRSSQGSGAR